MHCAPAVCTHLAESVIALARPMFDHNYRNLQPQLHDHRPTFDTQLAEGRHTVMLATAAT